MSDPGADADTIRDLERQRVQAMRDGDVATLDALFADEMFYLHSNASSDTKSSLLAKIRNRELHCRDVRHDQDDHVLVDGDTAVATGRVTGTVHVNDTPVRLGNRALAVWGRGDGRWRLLAYQSTPIPAA
jgi:ketosteroid isomerase-like protein